MMNKIRKFGIIVLIAFFCFTSTVSAFELDRSKQKELIKQVITETASQYGWTPGTSVSFTDAYGNTFTESIAFRPCNDCVELFVPVPDCTGKESLNVAVILVDVEIYVTEGGAKDRIKQLASASDDNNNIKTTSFHGHPAVSIANGGKYWQAGPFIFSVTGPIGCRNYWQITEALYTNAVKYGLITGDRATPVEDSDKDGVPDNMDKCPDTPAGTEVDENGCPIVKEMYLTLSANKNVYSGGETVIIQGILSSTQSTVLGAKIVIDINGNKIPLNIGSSGKYKYEYRLPKNIPQGTYMVKATASIPNYPNVSKSISFTVGKPEVQLEENSITKKPFIGIVADGVSSLQISVSLPGCSNVKVNNPDIGKLQGDTISFSGNIKLDSTGKAEVTYFPPNYLKENDLTQGINIHKWNSKIWAAEVPLTFAFKDADGNKKKIKINIAVCRPPVMLVHGFLGSTATWSKLSDYLQSKKFDTYLGDYGATGQSIEGLSLILRNDIQIEKNDYAKSNIKLAKVDIVGHSMGGLIARYYTHNLSTYAGDVRKLIMVGTPNHGVSWTKKVLGNIASGWYETHKIPAEQLYSKSSFMKKLNSGEKIGAHLNPDVQYGNIYGYPDDWVVSAASAYLNGVEDVLEFDVKHSPDLTGIPGTAITKSTKTNEQVKKWLTQDIYKPPLKGSHIEVYQFTGDVYLDDVKLTSFPKKFNSWSSLRTGKNSTAIVNMTVNDMPFGVIFLDPNSQIFLGYYSPQIVEVRLWEGSAAFRSKQNSHFSVPVSIDKTKEGEWWKCSPLTVVTGKGTEFAIFTGENIKVHCLEGSLVVDAPNSTKEGVVLSSNNSVAVKGENISTINSVSKEDFWWSTSEDHFLDSNPAIGILSQFNTFVVSLVNYFVPAVKYATTLYEKAQGICQILPDNVRQVVPEAACKNSLYIFIGAFILVIILLIKILIGKR